jgi:hypothetical protein
VRSLCGSVVPCETAAMRETQDSTDQTTLTNPRYIV